VVYESSTLHTTPSAHLQCARQVGRALEFIRQDGPAEEASSGLACIRSCSCGARIGTSSTSSTSYQRARALAQCVEAAAGRGADLHRTGGAVLNHGRTNRAPDRERLSRCRTTSTQTNGCRSLPDSRTSTSPSICGGTQGGSRLVTRLCMRDGRACAALFDAFHLRLPYKHEVYCVRILFFHRRGFMTLMIPGER
jgi:hypothetical protein